MFCKQKLCFVLLVSFASTAVLCVASFSLRPSNKAVITNSSLSMNCSADNTLDYICWVFQPYNGSKSPAKSCKPAVISSVHINSAQMSDAGRYGCLNAGIVKTASAELIVVGNVTCENNLTSVQNTIRANDRFTFQCVITYAGNWVPSMNCSQIFTTGKRTFQHSILLVNDTYSPDSAQRHAVYHSAVLATSGFNNSYTECRVYFDIAQKPNETTATNVPEINIVLMSEGIAVITDEDKLPVENFIAYKSMGLIALLALCALAIIVLIPALLKRRGDLRLKANVTTMASTSKSLISGDTTLLPSGHPRTQSPRYVTEPWITSSGFVDDTRLYSNVRGDVPTAEHDNAVTGQEYDEVDPHIYCEVEITPSSNNQQTQSVTRDYSGLYGQTGPSMQLKPSSVYTCINTSTYYNTEGQVTFQCSPDITCLLSADTVPPVCNSLRFLMACHVMQWEEIILIIFNNLVI